MVFSMRRQRTSIYDSLLTVSAVVLLLLYLFDPYHKLGKSDQNVDRRQLPKPKQEVDEIINFKPDSGTFGKVIQVEKTRTIDDVQSEECKAKTFAIGNTKASIIITVPRLDKLRPTLQSLQSHTPWRFVEEVIVIDHGDMTVSEIAKLKQMVTDDIAKGSVIKNAGLGHVSGRLQASSVTKGDVLIFLEAGAIVTKGWLEPILDILEHKPRTFVVPHFDKITEQSAFEALTEAHVPYIDRDMAIKMKESKETGNELSVASIRRECFAAKTQYFKRIGRLDPDVGDVGGVHQELSLRIWLCGGSITMAACSHVGIWGLFDPLIVRNPVNIWRIVEMWIKTDDWDPFLVTNNRPKNIAERVKKTVRSTMAVTRKELQCEADATSFINKFVPKLSLFFLKPTEEDLEFQRSMKVMVGRAGGRAGLLRSVSSRQCLSPDEDRVLQLGPCDPQKAGVARADMTFKLTRLSQLKVNGRCVTVAKHGYLRVMDCDNTNEIWNYREQQMFLWEDDGRMIFWYNKECIMHVMDPDPDKHGRPVVKLKNCNMQTDPSYWSFELLY